MGVGAESDVESDEGFKVSGIVTLQGPAGGITVVFRHSGVFLSSGNVLLTGIQN